MPIANQFSYKQLEQIMTDYCASHLGIKRFFSVMEEQVPNVVTPTESWPVVTMSPLSTVLGFDTNLHTVQITVYDRLEKDRDNYHDVVSDLLLILGDIRLFFGPDNDMFVSVYAESDPLAVPLNNVLMDYCYGWRMSITVEMPAIPFCYQPLVPAECAPAVFVNSDESYEEEIPSGERFAAPDITVTLGDGDQTFPSNTDIDLSDYVQPLPPLENTATITGFEILSYSAGTGPKGTDVYEFQFTVNANDQLNDTNIVMLISNFENGFEVNPSNDGSSGNMNVRTIAVAGFLDTFQNFYYGQFYYGPSGSTEDYEIDVQFLNTVTGQISVTQTLSVTLAPL